VLKNFRLVAKTMPTTEVVNIKRTPKLAFDHKNILQRRSIVSGKLAI